MARADVVWIGLRLSDIDAGDRVIVIEGKLDGGSDAPAGFRPLPASDEGVVAFERKGDVPRSGTARILRIGERTTAFVSPVEVPSVTRVLRDGPDEGRGDPRAAGILSLDLRPRRLAPSMEQRFPSIASIIRGVSRVRASAALVERGVRLDAEIQGKNKAAAERARRFLEALRDNVYSARYVELMRELELEQVESTVRIRWILPAKLLAALAAGAAGAAESTEPPASPASEGAPEPPPR
jgi:hypothetical protein